VSCNKAPTSVEIFAKSIQYVDQYLNTNAVGAEAAILKLERYLLECQKAGYRAGLGDIKLDQAFGGTYSRLYMIEKALGKDTAANQYYQKAAEHWRRLDSVEGRAPSAAGEIKQEIESVDARLAEPAWKMTK
jgi:hypothetical protein